uniref:Integrin subunit alpha 6 n=1 Tax=Scophthalmus maximus TaxID=52904 RepID=A0A8D3D3K5_SCOMX
MLLLLLLLQGRRSPPCAALLLMFHLLEPSVVLAFNLDTGHVIRKGGEPGSLFGFSLAMHRQLNPDKRMLLIGAPRARALGKQTANITGGLYKCEISQSNDCERIEFDNEEDIRVENKENQWMGVTVQSQGPGGKIVTCAHRYQRRLFVNTPQESRDITGRCYVLSQDLTIDTSSDEDGGSWNFCEGRARGHEMFGSCQQGLAATFTKDYHYVVFGAPGAYNWKGIVRVEQKNNTLLEMGVYDDGPYEVGDEHLLNPELVPVPANSYLGFSLDSGHSITRSRGLTVVAGAPRANHNGAVVLLKKEREASARLSVEHALHGPGLASSFGYDVAVVDLNGDGWVNISLALYSDIVVGAPQFYMKDGDVGGAVYVYINKAGRWDKITPIHHELRLFGYSLAGNMDLDGNSYPDLAVGSLSDTALIYRARPVISLRRDVKISPQEIDLTVKACGNSICFTVDACFSYIANPASYSPRLTISYSVEADGDRRKQGLPSRVTFMNKSRQLGFIKTFGPLKKINWAIFQVKMPDDNIKDKMRSIPIEVSAEILGTKRQKSRNGLPQLMPILDSSQLSKETIEVNMQTVNFVKEGCGSDHVCRSNLKMEYKLYYKQNNMHDLLIIRNNIPVFHLNYERKDLALQVTVNNMNGDDAYEAKLVGTFPDTLSYSGVRSNQTVPIICTANQNGSQADCELGNPFKRDSETTFYIILSTVGMSLDTTEIDIDLQLHTTSVQKNIATVKIKAQVVIELPLSVSGEASPNQVSFGGVVKGESAMKKEEEIGSLINYTFRINNLWKSLKPSVKASLHIQWPKLNKDGKWLLYLVRITAKGQEDIRCSPESEINSLKHIQESAVSRTKREIERKERKSGGKRSSLEIACVVLKCPLQGLDGTTIELRSRLWNSTFIEDYASVSTLHIVVKASLVLHSQTENMILKTTDIDVTVAVSPESAVAQYGGVPWWIILVAVLAGIMILALLVFLLWKCGFFRRATKDQYDAAYHKAEIHVQPSDKDKLTAEA